MITVERIPASARAQYLAGLNACFHDWGGDDMYRWCFERGLSGQLPDLLGVQEQGRLVAGSAVSYRRAQVAGRTPFRVAIMSGSWTLPEARQRGYFTQMIDASRAVAAERGAALLLAFVTSTNPSYRRLAAARATHWETWYLGSSANMRVVTSTAAIQPVTDVRRGVAEILERLDAPSAQSIRFLYDADEWLSQFLARPIETEFLSVGTDGLAVIEKREDADRLLFFRGADDASFARALDALLERAAARGRTLSFFTTRRNWRNISTAAGFNCLPGYLVALTANADARRAGVPNDDLAGLPWELQSGDRM